LLKQALFIRRVIIKTGVKCILRLSLFVQVFLAVFSLFLTGPGATISYNATAYYINGINVPWNQFGSDAGSHYQWGHLYNPTWFETFFTQCQQYGVNCCRLWIHCDGRSSPEFNDSGYVTGLDPTFLSDFEDILARGQAHKVMVMPCLWSFDMTKDNTGGAGKYGGKHSDLIRDSLKTRSYIDKALVPMVSKFANTPNLFAWEIINEPEWSVSDIQAGGAGDMVTKVEMQRFCGLIAAAIHDNSGKMVTVGSASLKWCSPRVGPAILNMWRDSGLKAATNNNPKAVLDFYQIHYYDWMNNADWGYDPFQLSPAKTPGWWKLDKPVLVGECPATNGVYTTAQMVANCFANGYCGIMPWSYNANDGAGTWNGVRDQLKAFRDSHSAIVDYVSTPVCDRPGNAGGFHRPIHKKDHFAVFCGAASQMLTLPEGMCHCTIFDAQGRVLLRFDRPFGMAGPLRVNLPKITAEAIGVVLFTK
jgi:hypothetical protein